ncbi:MAG: histidine kinase dimerization/phospho-acceptor domain-containing protein, partial [Methylomonas sp.]
MSLNFQTRIALFYSALFVAMQVLTLISVYWVSRENIINQIGQNLIYAENIFNRTLTAQGEQIATGTRILASDFGFRSAASDGDPETLNSALQNLIYRIQGQRGFYIDMQGKVIADTGGGHQGHDFMFPAAIAQADAEGKSVMFGMLDGKLCELAVVPVLAPIPIGWVGVAIAVDSRLADNFKHMSSAPPDVTMLLQDGDHVQIIFSSLANPRPELFADRIFHAPLAGQQPPSLIGFDGETYVSLVRPLHTARNDQAIKVVLQIDLRQALQPYAILVYAVFGLMAFGLLSTLLGTYLLARNIAQPLRELAGASQRIFSGGFNKPLPVTSNDELGRLAETFNTAGRMAEEMAALKEQDLQRRELMASVSHDLRTPLTSLHGYLETMQLQAHRFPEEERKQFLAVAVRQSEKVGRLAQELFELAKLECQATTVQAEVFNLQELVQDVTQKYAMTAMKCGVTLRAGLNCDVPLVYADIAMIERVLTNLIDNAIRHTPAMGEVNIGLFSAGGRVAVEVSDTGEG